MSMAVDARFFDACNLERGVFYVRGQLEGYRTKRARRNELDLEDARFLFFDVCNHLHLAKRHSRFRVNHLPHSFTDFVLYFCQI